MTEKINGQGAAQIRNAAETSGTSPVSLQSVAASHAAAVTKDVVDQLHAKAASGLNPYPGVRFSYKEHDHAAVVKSSASVPAAERTLIKSQAWNEAMGSRLKAALKDEGLLLVHFDLRVTQKDGDLVQTAQVVVRDEEFVVELEKNASLYQKFFGLGLDRTIGEFLT